MIPAILGGLLLLVVVGVSVWAEHRHDQKRKQEYSEYIYRRRTRRLSRMPE